MNIIILGTGGCTSTPQPLCDCPVCVEARDKGRPYARFGASLYIEDAALLVDTPEDIVPALNYSRIMAVDNILYSHWDPDHTLGMRVMEQLRLDWLDYDEGKKPDSPIAIYAHPQVLADVAAISSKFGSFLDYYEHLGLVVKKPVLETEASHPAGDERTVNIGGLTVSIVSVPKEKAVSVFVFEQGEKKLIYAPCDCIPYPKSDLFLDADILITGRFCPPGPLKNGRIYHPHGALKDEIISAEGLMAFKEKYRIKRIYVTHIEELWGKSYDDYRAIEKEYENLVFAWDGMKIAL